MWASRFSEILSASVLFFMIAVELKDSEYNEN